MGLRAFHRSLAPRQAEKVYYSAINNLLNING